MKEFRSFEKHLTAVDGDGSKRLTLTRGTLINCQVVILIAGVTAADIASIMSIKVKAGLSSIDLANATDLITDASGTTDGCLVRIDFPIHALEITAVPNGADINITVYGGNK